MFCVTPVLRTGYEYLHVPIFYLQVVYTSIGNLAYQFLMLNIDGATRNGALSLSVDNQKSNIYLPDCIELLRMMHQQVEYTHATSL